MLSHDLSPAQGDKSCQNVHLLHYLSALCQYNCNNPPPPPPPPHTHTQNSVCVWRGGGGQIITVMLAKGCQMGHVINILINLSQPHTTLHNTFIPPRLKLVKGLTINKQYYLINILSNIMQKRETIISKLLSIINTVSFLLNSLQWQILSTNPPRIPVLVIHVSILTNQAHVHTLVTRCLITSSVNHTNAHYIQDTF